MTAINRDINRAKTFSYEIFTICPFLRKHLDALVSANDIHSFTNRKNEKEKRENLQKLKNLLFMLPKKTKHM